VPDRTPTVPTAWVYEAVPVAVEPSEPLFVLVPEVVYDPRLRSDEAVAVALLFAVPVPVREDDPPVASTPPLQWVAEWEAVEPSLAVADREDESAEVEVRLAVLPVSLDDAEAVDEEADQFDPPFVLVDWW
jgi:hypothetical protein